MYARADTLLRLARHHLIISSIRICTSKEINAINGQSRRHLVVFFTLIILLIGRLLRIFKLALICPLVLVLDAHEVSHAYLTRCWLAAPTSHTIRLHFLDNREVVWPLYHLLIVGRRCICSTLTTISACT